MLATRIIPSLLCRGRQLVKGSKFNSWRSVGLAEQAVRIYQQRGVDELILLDIGATPEGRGPDLELIRQLTDGCFMPLTVGGGVRSIDDVRALLNAGADKVAICTAAYEKNGLIKQCSERFGKQAICAAIDVASLPNAPQRWGARTRCGTKAIGRGIGTIAERLECAGAGEILLTSIDREGTMQGYDLDLISKVSKSVTIPVIAHGGCSSYEDMHNAILAGASAVAAGALFQFTDCTPRGAAENLKTKGVEVRL